ncbi:hypothetical protein ABPG77_004925 [Micractinium sp. CCAP 211/92]
MDPDAVQSSSGAGLPDAAQSAPSAQAAGSARASGANGWAAGDHVNDASTVHPIQGAVMSSAAGSHGPPASVPVKVEPTHLQEPRASVAPAPPAVNLQMASPAGPFVVHAAAPAVSAAAPRAALLGMAAQAAPTGGLQFSPPAAPAASAPLPEQTAAAAPPAPMPLSPPAAAQMGAAKPGAMDAGSNLAALARLEQLQQGSRQQQEQRLQQPLRALQPLQPAAQPAASLPHPSRPALQPAASLPQSLQPALQPAGSLPQQMQPAVQPTASPPKPVAPLPQQAQQAGVPLAPTPPEPPVDSLSLADLRQAFFDQPSELPALRARLAELEDLRKQCMFPDGGALWDGLLARLRRYLLLLEREAAEQAPAAESGSAAAPFAPRCDLCGRQQAPGTPLHLRRMQLMGVRQHLAVCAACAEARRGTLIPLTPTWQLDPVAWGALMKRAAPTPQAPHPAAGGGSGRGRGRKKDAAAAVADSGGGSRPGSVVGHRGKSTFKATSCAWLKLITKGNLQPSAGLAPRVYLPFGVYWFWVDRLPGAEAMASEADAPRAMRLAHAESGAAWHVPLLRTDDGMQLQPAALRPMFDQLGVQIDSSLLIELREEECSLAGGFVATVRLVGRGEPQPDLPGSPIGLPRHPATASGLQACKKRKGTHTSSRQERATGDGGGDTATGGGRGRASAEAYEWDDAWDERSDADVSFSLPAGQPVDGPAAGRSRRRGAGSRLASILRQEVPEAEDEVDDEDFVVAPEQGASEQDEAEQTPLPFEPRRTPSISAALELAQGLHPEAPIAGAHAPSPGTSQKWGVYIKRGGYQQQWFGRLDRQRAAVAADVVMTWQGRLARQVEMEKLLAGEPQYGAAAPAQGAGDGAEAAELAAEVAAMAAMAAGLGSPPPGPSAMLPRTSSFSGTAAASGDVDMTEAGEEAEATTAAAPGAGSRVLRSLNLPEAGYLQDEELMQQLGQVESPQQMLMLLTGVIPQDPLPRHLQRHAVRPPSSQRQNRPPLPRRPSQQLLPQQGQQAGAQPPAATQHGQAHLVATGRPPKPLHQRKPKKPVGPQQQATGVAGQHQAAAGNERRHVGVVLEGEGWAAAAVCALSGSEPVTLRVSGLSTLEQAEVARDLLALWGWQAAQREQQQAQQTQQTQQSSAGGEEGASPSSPPLPPLNFPYSAYVESTPWVEGLAGLNVEEVERFARSAVDQLSKETLAELQAAAGPPPGAVASPAATPAAVEAAAPSEVGEDQSDGGSEPGGADGADHFDLLAALADVAGGELGPTPERPAARAAKGAAGAPAASMGVEDQPSGAGRTLADAGAMHQVPGSPFAAQQHVQLPRDPAQVLQAPGQQQEGAFLRQPSTASAAGQQPGSSPPRPASPAGGLSGAGSGGAALAARVEAATQRKVAQALVAFEEADLSSADSMLRPLRLLAVANKGGQLLRDIVRSWRSYSPSQQQEVFDAALMATNERDWGPQLEETLRLALDLL